MLYVIQEINGQLVQLRKELERMKQSADSQIVQTALASVQALIKKPPELFNQYAAMAALEHLVSVAKDKGDSEAENIWLFYASVFQHCCVCACVLIGLSMTYPCTTAAAAWD